MTKRTKALVKASHLSQNSSEINKCVICDQVSIMNLSYKGKTIFACPDHLAEAETLMRVSAEFFEGRSF